MPLRAVLCKTGKNWTHNPIEDEICQWTSKLTRWSRRIRNANLADSKGEIRCSKVSAVDNGFSTKP